MLDPFTVLKLYFYKVWFHHQKHALVKCPEYYSALRQANALIRCVVLEFLYSFS
jgi:hypothetical protein